MYMVVSEHGSADVVVRAHASAEVVELSADGLTLQEQIGKGSFGRVFKAQDRLSGRSVAVKILDIDDDPELQDLREEAQREVQMLGRCNCPNVLLYLGSFWQGRSLWLVTELCAAGSLVDVMRANGPLTEAPLAATLSGTLVALDYLHTQMNCIHRDVKAANLLLSRVGMVKLADFGVSVQLSKTMASRCTAIGTPHWMAPEVVQEGEYTSSADIWSLGITCIELAELHPPLWHLRPVMRARKPNAHMACLLHMHVHVHACMCMHACVWRLWHPRLVMYASTCICSSMHMAYNICTASKACHAPTVAMD